MQNDIDPAFFNRDRIPRFEVSPTNAIAAVVACNGIRGVACRDRRTVYCRDGNLQSEFRAIHR